MLVKGGEIDEGFLRCSKCGLDFPVIFKIPILWDDFASYLSNRPSLGGELLLGAKTKKMKTFVRNALRQIRKNPSDIAAIEKRWAKIYTANKKSEFYSKIKKILDRVKTDLTLEHGCSIGHMTGHIAERSNFAFGTDKSFYAIMEAKKIKQSNLDFFVADSLEQPFGKTKFGLILALNLFELIEPKPLLRLLAGQVDGDGALVLSDPYDFERGQKSVKEPMSPISLRSELRRNGFVVSRDTKKPSHVQWNLRLNDRASLNYLVDVIVANKSSKAAKKGLQNNGLHGF
jgi:SAM-dependent methyltransferase